MCTRPVAPLLSHLEGQQYFQLVNRRVSLHHNLLECHLQSQLCNPQVPPPLSQCLTQAQDQAGSHRHNPRHNLQCNQSLIQPQDQREDRRVVHPHNPLVFPLLYLQHNHLSIHLLRQERTRPPLRLHNLFKHPPRSRLLSLQGIQVLVLSADLRRVRLQHRQWCLLHSHRHRLRPNQLAVPVVHPLNQRLSLRIRQHNQALSPLDNQHGSQLGNRPLNPRDSLSGVPLDSPLDSQLDSQLDSLHDSQLASLLDNQLGSQLLSPFVIRPPGQLPSLLVSRRDSRSVGPLVNPLGNLWESPLLSPAVRHHHVPLPYRRQHQLHDHPGDPALIPPVSRLPGRHHNHTHHPAQYHPRHHHLSLPGNPLLVPAVNPP